MVYEAVGGDSRRADDEPPRGAAERSLRMFYDVI